MGEWGEWGEWESGEGGCSRESGEGMAVMNSVIAYPQSKASLEERYCVLSEQLMSTKEALARSEVEANGHQQECERLRQELASMKEAHSELEETLQATEEAYHEVERERKDMETLAKETEEKVRSLRTPGLLNCSAKLHVSYLCCWVVHSQVTVLEASLVEAGQRAQAQQQQVASLQQSLSHAQENTQSVQREKSSIAEQKVRTLCDFPLYCVIPPTHSHTITHRASCSQRSCLCNNVCQGCRRSCEEAVQERNNSGGRWNTSHR